MNNHTPPRIPEIPGDLVPEATALHLKQHVATLCGTERGFPGSQPVSFTNASLQKLEQKNFWVCEKSDGVRVILLIVQKNNTQQEVFLLDRKDSFRQVYNLVFPHHDASVNMGMLKDTLLDGELVLDINPSTGQETLRFYAFDCLVYHGANLMSSGLQSRYGRLKNWVVAEAKKHLKNHPERVPHQPFQIICKTMELAYAVEKVLKVDIPALEHGHDGLIFTCAETGYVVGTDEMIMKWKPPEDNTIDFRLSLRFPPLPSSDQPDFEAKPMFLLWQWEGERKEETFFDEMEVDDEEWENLKLSGEQLDDRVVECRLNPATGAWKLMRFRDDKSNGNYAKIVDKILNSIRDGVQLEELVSRSKQIRTKWKDRDAQRQNASQAPRPAPPPQGYSGVPSGGAGHRPPPVSMLRR